MSIEASVADELRQGLLKHLWRQWQAIGATVSSAGRSASSIVDPEALILMSLWMRPQEQRLADVLTSWITVNSGLVGIQRLQNLLSGFPGSVADDLSALAETGIKQAKDIRWRSLRGKGSPTTLGQRNNKVRAVEPRFDAWPTLLLQLRRGMGVGAKADVLAFLLGSKDEREWWSVAAISESLGYTPAAIRRVADDLAAARFIRRPGTGEADPGVQRLYSADPASWTGLLRVSPHFLGWGYWRERFLFCIEALTWLEQVGHEAPSPYVTDVGARELLSRHASVFLRNSVMYPPDFEVAEHNLEFLKQAIQRLLGWMENQA